MLNTQEATIAQQSMGVLGRHVVRRSLIAAFLGSLISAVSSMNIIPSGQSVFETIVLIHSWLSAYYVVPAVVASLFAFSLYLMLTRIAILSQLALRENLEPSDAQYAKALTQPVRKLERAVRRKPKSAVNEVITWPNLINLRA